jgi:hypothetical protein
MLLQSLSGEGDGGRNEFTYNRMYLNFHHMYENKLRYVTTTHETGGNIRDGKSGLFPEKKTQ